MRSWAFFYNEKAVEAVNHKFGLAGDIEVFMNGEAVTKGKPHPEIFLTTAEKLGVNPEDCVVIEDSRNGVLGSKSSWYEVYLF